MLGHACLKNASVYRFSYGLDVKNTAVFYCYFFQMGTKVIDGVVVLICMWSMG